MEQMTLWEYLYDTKTIDKPIRLIELFAGIGSQYKAIKQLTDKVESWKICEWAYNSYCCYNSIHHKDFTDYANGLSREELIKGVKGTSINYNEPLTEEQLNKKSIEWLKSAYNNIKATHNLVNIMEVKGDDLEIIDTDKYEYILTYSFPCQDLSLAGNQKGMSVSQKEGGTRSGLLWEVERILTELYDSKKALPQVLLMENVPEVCGSKNVNDFAKWQLKLTQLGYQNYVEILNAKDYGIPQNRKRCFMISVLGDYSYSFPRKLKLELKLKDMLEKSVDEKYYLTINQLKDINGWNSFQKPLEHIDDKIVGTITTRDGDYTSSMKLVSDNDEKKAVFEYLENDMNSQPSFIAIKNNTEKGYLEAEEGDGVNIQGRMQYQRGNVQKESIPTLTTMGGNDIGVVVKEKSLKKELCQKLIDDNLVEEGDVIEHNYTQQILDGKKKCVESKDEMICLTTRSDCIGVVVKENDNKNMFSETEKKLFTEDGNVYRYIGAEQIDIFKDGDMATTSFPNGYGHGPRTHDGESVALNTIDRPVVKQNLRIRKLTPKECMRLMGFQDTDFQACKDIGMSDSAIYHIAGDSIVVCVLIALFSKLFTDKDHTEIIKKYIDEIKENNL